MNGGIKKDKAKKSGMQKILKNQRMSARNIDLKIQKR
jgi:hypothetical protein